MKTHLTTHLFRAANLFCLLLLWVGTAGADQAEYITKEQAERAALLLKDKGEIKHHCADCDDKSIRPETINSIQAAPVGDGENWQVKLNGKGIDLAYVYFKNAAGQWKNAAIELTIPVEGVPPVLPSGPPVFTEADLVQSTTSPQTSGEFLTRGSQWFRNRNWDKAIADFNESLKTREDNATAYLMRGTAQINKKNYDAALADLNKALQLDKSEYLTHFRLSELYKVQNKTAENTKARQTGSELLKVQAAPRTAKEFIERGEYFELRGFSGDAIAYYGEAIKLDAKYAPAYEKRGDLYSFTGKYDEALADYNKFIELEPQRVMSYVRRTEIMELSELFGERKKNYSEELLRDYSETIKRAEAFEWNSDPLRIAYLGRAEIYYGKREWDKAIADYSAALKLDPKNSEAYLDRGQAWFNKKDYEKAIRDYDYALVINPKGAGIVQERGDAYKELFLHDKALADYSKAIELNAKFADPLFSRGLIYLNRGESDKAIEDYTKAIALNPKNDAYFNNRGIAYFNKKEWDKAIADLDEAIKLNEKNANSWNNRAAAYKAKEEWDKAVADYTQAIALKPDYIMAYKNRAAVYRKQNKTGLADADEKKAKELEGQPAAPAPNTAANPAPPAANFDDDDGFFFF